ncbi:NADP-dependent oxidoreductase domain-containing protein, partial [Lipomyces japonicus]|uniref:NADP-dependent oxidoreductase domain-containing protein n=1 Tax=Lipomyces japonicus TaxID=56871 RepID=UPI0034CF86F0
MSDKVRVILGLMTFGPADEGAAKITTQEGTKEIFQRFKDRGYSEVDTARGYANGNQEAWTAQAGYKTTFNFKLATKVYPRVPGVHSASELRKLFTKSLEELQTDSVDIFYLHAPDRSVPFLETLQTVNEFYKEGKFKIFGLSNFTAYEVAEIVTTTKFQGLVRPTLYQAKYNVLTRSIEDELVPALHLYGLDLVVYNPLAGGFFSGKYSKDKEVTEGRFSLNSVLGSNYQSRYFRDGYWSALDIIQPVVEKNNLTLLEVALRWLVHHSILKLGSADSLKGDGIIIGVSSLSQLDADLDAIEKGPLPQDVVDVLDEAWILVKKDIGPYWHGKLEYSYKFD